MIASNSIDRPVVVAVDGSEPSLAAARWAAAEAVRLPAALLLVTAYGLADAAFAGRAHLPREWLDAQKEQAEQTLRDARTVAAEIAPGLATDLLASPLGAVSTLLELSCRARMLVLGEPVGPVLGLLAGGTAVPVLSGAHCPVTVVRGRERGRPSDGPVVVGVDGGPMSDALIGHAFAEAASRKASLVAVHTWNDGDFSVVFSDSRARFDWEPIHDTEQRALAERLAGWRARYPDVEVERVVVQDKPRHQLLEWSEKAQLIVVGSRGRGGFTGMLLGSTSQALIHHADCPVTVVSVRLRTFTTAAGSRTFHHR